MCTRRQRGRSRIQRPAATVQPASNAGLTRRIDRRSTAYAAKAVAAASITRDGIRCNAVSAFRFIGIVAGVLYCTVEKLSCCLMTET